MRHVTGTLISYYFYCKRRVWLHANDIRYENTSDDVTMGRLIEDSSYMQRNCNYEQIELDGIKIDFYDHRNKIIHEIKKSSKYEETHLWQLRYYIYILKKKGITGVSGILEYPSERQKTEVSLTENEIQEIENLCQIIKNIIENNVCPPPNKNAKCKNCSYFEFCYSSEPDVD